MKKFIQIQLTILAKAILAKYKPEIIGITGSVGKTGAREAVYAVLSPGFNARRSVKNYNNEIGVPLTVIGAQAPGKSVFGWVGVFLKAVKLILIKDEAYPEILILEMGVDRPGDMKYLLGIARPKIGVITSVSESHLEFFNSVEDIKKEKGLLVGKLPKSGYAALNYDDEKVRKIADDCDCKTITYGFNEGADVRAYNLRNPNFKGRVSVALFQEGGGGVSFKLGHRDSSADVNLPDTIGLPAVMAALAASAIGLIYGLKLNDIAKALGGRRPPNGRMSLIPGVKHTLIIDDTYNSSPRSAIAALDAAGNIALPEGGRKFAVLGDMLELGNFTEEGHRLVGEKVVESGINKLIAVGEKARDIARGAEAAGMGQDNIFHFPDADGARVFVQERIGEGDLILIKGSQGMRMEKIVKEIMAEPLRAEELLVRQGEEWMKRRA